MHAIAAWWETLCKRFGNGWNRFWFLPSDPYTLGVIRLLTGLVALYWYATYTPDLLRFFGKSGLLPVASVSLLEGGRFSFSYLNYLSSSTDLAIAHWVGLAILIAFAIGFATRITSVLALVVVLSYIHRGPMLTAQTEPILSMVMVYLCLGPSGASWSVDCYLARRKLGSAATADSPSCSFAATISLRLIQVHLAMLVGLMALSQLMGETWWQGMGVWWLAARTESRMFDLSWLHDHQFVINFWTHAIVFFELAFVALVWQPLARPLLLALGVLVWTSVAVLTGNVPFALILIIASLAFVPGEILRGCCAGCCRPKATTPA